MPAIPLLSLRHASTRGALGGLAVAVLVATVPAPVLAAVTVVFTEPAALAEPAPGPAPGASTQPEALLAECDQLMAAGKPAEAAEILATAYLVMSPELRVGEAGQAVVSMASNAYEAAWQASGDAAQLEANRVLLAAYLADLEAARAAGEATVPVDAQHEALQGRHASLVDMLAELRARKAPASGEPSAAELDPGPVEAQVEITFPPPDPRLRRNALLIIGAGATGTVAGGIMVIAGAMAASRAEEERRITPVDEAGDLRRAKTGATILATSGALLFSTSMMLLGVGSARLGRYRQDLRDLQVSLHPTLGGMALRGRF